MTACATPGFEIASQFSIGLTVQVDGDVWALKELPGLGKGGNCLWIESE